MRQTLKTMAAIFGIAVAVNYPWELAQTPLYEGMGDFSRMLWHCFVASLGDGMLLLLIFGVGWAVLRRRDWFIHPGGRGYALMLAMGLFVAVAVEWTAVQIAGEWAYNARMPVVPLLGVGLAPVAQMLLLPPLIFQIVARLALQPGRRTANGAGGSSPKR
jgi:hypothetical protein